MNEHQIAHNRILIYASQLYEEFDAICYSYRVSLKKPIITVEDMGNRLGSWNASASEIKINLSLILSEPWESVLGILKHEMAHQITSEVFHVSDEAPHGLYFKKACDLIGVPEWARHAFIKESYEDISSLRLFKPDSKQEAILRKVEKLLALANSVNEHEAVAAVKKVKELSDAYQLNEASFFKRDDYDTLVICHNKKMVPYYQKKICSILIHFFCVKVVFSHSFDAKSLQTYKTMVLLGSKSHLQIAEYVYWFLFRQLPALFDEYKKTKSRVLKKARDSFYLGVLEGFSKQLSDMEKATAEVQELSGLSSKKREALVALADKKLEDFMGYHFPRLHTVARGSRSLDRASFQAGHKEGEKLKLRKGLSSSGGFGGYLSS